MKYRAAGPAKSSLSLQQSVADIGARIDKLRFSAWHARTLAVVGTAHLFDIFDAMAMTFVLPVLIFQWKLSGFEAGILLAASYAGQFIGAIGGGVLASRAGRRRTLRWALFTLSLLSLACAGATGYHMMLVLRFGQGLGLGAEMPVAATYINEIAPARLRGRLAFVPQIMAGLGALFAALVALGVIVRFGWQAMFIVGTLPVILAILLPRLIPESPRWLASVGRYKDADVVLTSIEHAQTVDKPPTCNGELPLPSSSTGGLFSEGRARGTIVVWAAMVCTALASYGIINWLPAIYTGVYHLPMQKAFSYITVISILGPMGGVIGLSLIDRLGRRGTYTIGFVGTGLPLLALYGLGVAHGEPSLAAVFWLTAITILFASVNLSGLYVYAAEIYPISIRALGVGAASSWLRFGTILAPLIVGWMLDHSPLKFVFLLLGGVAVLGAATVLLLMRETAGRTFEEIAAENLTRSRQAAAPRRSWDPFHR